MNSRCPTFTRRFAAPAAASALVALDVVVVGVSVVVPMPAAV